MKIQLFACSYNEEYILPFFLDHYSFCDRIIVCDRGSTDKTIEILKNNKKVFLIEEPIPFVDERSLIYTKNNKYKYFQEKYFDWQIVCDIDELLYHENILEFLSEQKNKGTTIINTEGYTMIGLDGLMSNIPIIEQIKVGNKDKGYNKNIIFNPNEITDINYVSGSHRCKPKGNVKYNEENENLKLLHYHFLRYDLFIKKAESGVKRLSFNNKLYSEGSHRYKYMKYTMEDYVNLYKKAIQII